ncbi:MAG: DUF1566 domain-containing protein [Smithellaceae bacterium]
MVATFSTTGVRVEVGAEEQVSGVTANDFTNPVAYTVTAENGSTQDYIVSVILAIALPRTGQTVSYGTGDDGALRAGVAWPGTRFQDNSDGTITDNLTGLLWMQNAGPGAWLTWQEALDYVAGLNLTNHLGFSDWRLPNINELESLTNAGQGNPVAWLNSQGFINVGATKYWSSTTVAYEQDLAWTVDFAALESVGHDVKEESRNYWPVRGGDTGAVRLPKTGQAASYAAGDDGDLQMGSLLPQTRFADNGDGSVTDKLTGLVWLKNANCFSSRSWENALEDANTLSSGDCDLSDGSAQGDWRLPNRKELRSLVHYDQTNQGLWLADQGFTDVQTAGYWTSTTDAGSTTNAWQIEMMRGFDGKPGKSTGNFVWPVRGGSLSIPGNILVVAYDVTSAAVMENAIVANGSQSTQVSRAVFEATSVDDLLQYDAVFYAGGHSGDAWVKAIAYLDAGGRLFIADNDLGYSNSSTTFYQQYLQATYLTDAGSQGVLTGLGIMAGINPDTSYDPFPDDFIVGAQGTMIFQAPAPNTNAAGVAVSRNGYKAVYLAWDFDDTALDADEEAIVGVIMNYFRN